MTTTKFSLTLTVADRESMDGQLDAAVATAKVRALAEKRQGILVTRNAADKFTVALSEAVPFGLTREHQAW